MEKFVIDEIKDFLKLKNKKLKNSKILLMGLSYKPGVADLRNSINLKIFKTLEKQSKSVKVYDPFLNEDTKLKYSIFNRINIKNNYDIILFLSKNSHFENQYKKLKKNGNKSKFIDPFEYYE